MQKPLILVCNDDGIFASGIKALTQVASKFGDVIVVAPDKPQSGMGMSITINKPLRFRKVDFDHAQEAYATDGTPVDGVKLAMHKILSRTPDLVLSGINHGANSSVNVMYSGTMSAAIEGAMENIPSIGFSLLDHSIDANFNPSKTFISKIIEHTLTRKLAPHTCLNVNIPALPEEAIKGIKVCRQANGNWTEELEERFDPMGSKYYWLTGKYESTDKTPDTDIWALENGFVSVVPIQYDLTHHPSITNFEHWPFS